MNVLFSLIFLFNGEAYVLDYNMSASDCVAAIQTEVIAGNDITPYQCVAQPNAITQ
ncbi:hypothetical protein [Xanthomonas phage JGB6]|nr:hypothetical protein [Xanthomonas phage JGB6]